MKQNKIGLLISTFSIIAFIVTVIVVIILTNKAIQTEQQKANYYAKLYGLEDKADLIENEPIKFPSQEYLMDQNSKEYNALEKLRALHAQSEYFLMGGRIEAYTPEATDSWTKIIESTFLQQAEYETIRDSLSAEKDLTTDMNNLISLLHIASEQRNLEALRYMHRILHDLDLYAFPAQGAAATGYWGATYTVPSSSSSQINEINTFIEKHTVSP